MFGENFNNLEQLLKLKKNSRKTIKSYLYYNRKFLEHANKSPREIQTQDIKNYLEYLVDKKFSASTLNLAYNALKFYYHNFYKRNFFVNIPRAKKDKRLPVVLSKEEIEKLIEVTDNKKHKFAIQFLYSTGLRVSELVKVKIEDVDLKRRLVLVRGGKGAKDRYSLLANCLLNTLKVQQELKKPGDYLFTSRDGKTHWHVMSAQKVVKEASERAGINKNVSAHILRHSFATHLLESGTDIRYIQEFLGHKNLETTQVYTKVARNKLSDIINPLDI